MEDEGEEYALQTAERQIARGRYSGGEDDDFDDYEDRGPYYPALHGLSRSEVHGIESEYGLTSSADFDSGVEAVTFPGQSRKHYDNVAKAFEAQKESFASQQRAANLQKAKVLGARGIMSRSRVRVEEPSSMEMVPFRPRSVRARDDYGMVDWSSRPSKIYARAPNRSSVDEDVIDIDTSDPRWRRKRPREDPEPDYFSQPRSKKTFYDKAEDILDKVHRGVKRAHSGWRKASDIMNMINDVAQVGNSALSDYEMLNNAGMIAYDQPSPMQLAYQASQGTGGQMGYDEDKDEAMQLAKLRSAQGRRSYRIDDDNPPPSKTSVAYRDIVHRGICIDEGSRYQKVMCTDFALHSSIVNWYGTQIGFVPTDFDSFTVQSASPNTTNAVVLNDIGAGSDIFNRIGRRVEMVRLEIRAVLTYATEAATASESLDLGNASRVLLILDKQPNTVSPYIPGFDSVCKCYNNGGGADWNPFTCYNPDNANRFDILYDTLLAQQDSVEVTNSAAYTEAKTRTFDINLKLNNISTRYKDDNALWSSIASNQLILMVVSNYNNRHILNNVAADPTHNGQFGYYDSTTAWHQTNPNTESGCQYKLVGSAALNFIDA